MSHRQMSLVAIMLGSSVAVIVRATSPEEKGSLGQLFFACIVFSIMILGFLELLAWRHRQHLRLLNQVYGQSTLSSHAPYRGSAARNDVCLNLIYTADGDPATTVLCGRDIEDLEVKKRQYLVQRYVDPASLQERLPIDPVHLAWSDLNRLDNKRH